MTFNDTSANSGQDIANLFGNYFSFSPNINIHSSTISACQNTVDLNNIAFTIGDIFEGL